MSDYKDLKSDREIAKKFDELFNSLPEFVTDEEINIFLIESGYDPKSLEEMGREFAAKLINRNWRYKSDEYLDKEASMIRFAPPHIGKGKDWLIRIIQINAPNDFQFANRNFQDLTEEDLISILQEIESYLLKKGKKLREK